MKPRGLRLRWWLIGSSSQRLPIFVRGLPSVTKQSEVIILENGHEASYFMSVDAILSVENGQKAVNAGDVLARIPRESSKTRDITGGLPRVAELFEARRPKDHAIIAESEGRVEFGKDYKNKRRVIVQPIEEDE